MQLAALRQAREKKRPPPSDSDISEGERPETEDDEEYGVRCAACGHVVSHVAWRIAKDDEADHVFTNPHGFTFHVICFQKAPGAASIGPASTQWSWFAGYEWRGAVCGGCSAHLGWSFDRDDDRFWGLIVARLDIVEG